MATLNFKKEGSEILPCVQKEENQKYWGISLMTTSPLFQWKWGVGSGLQVLGVSRVILVGVLRGLNMFSMVLTSLQPP